MGSCAARLLLTFCVVLAAAPAGAQVYKWVDANGVTHYGERPPGNLPAAPAKLDIRTVGNDPVPSPATAGCYTIQCQYERMRDDRLLRDAEWRKDLEARARASALIRDSERPDTPAATPTWIVGTPVVPVARRGGPIHPHHGATGGTAGGLAGPSDPGASIGVRLRRR